MSVFRVLLGVICSQANDLWKEFIMCTLMVVEVGIVPTLLWYSLSSKTCVPTSIRALGVSFICLDINTTWDEREAKSGWIGMDICINRWHLGIGLWLLEPKEYWNEDS